jgi:hypothetical protein
LTYEEMLAVARSHPESVDFAAFRLAFTRTSAYAPYDVDALEEDEALEEAAGMPDWPAVLIRANAALERCYVRMKPHIYAAMACEALGDGPGQRHHEQCVTGLLASIMESGDGRTPETGFVVIGVWEEYDVLNALRLQTVRQALLPVGARRVDQMSVLAPDNSEPFDLYFDVTLPMTAIHQQIDRESEPPLGER